MLSGSPTMQNIAAAPWFAVAKPEVGERRITVDDINPAVPIIRNVP